MSKWRLRSNDPTRPGKGGRVLGAVLLPEEEADAVLVDEVFRGSKHGVASALKVKKGPAKVKGKTAGRLGLNQTA